MIEFLKNKSIFCLLLLIFSLTSCSGETATSTTKFYNTQEIQDWMEMNKANDVDNYYINQIKGRFDCRLGGVPNY